MELGMPSKALSEKLHQVIEYYPDNQTLCSIILCNEQNIPDGPGLFYYEDGTTLNAQGSYKGGQRVRTWKRYREDGSLEIIEKFNDSGQQTRSQYYDKDGRLLHWEHYNANGDVTLRELHHDDGGKTKTYIDPQTGQVTQTMRIDAYGKKIEPEIPLLDL